MKHDLKLATIPFEAIKSGVKTIESRLYDEKRKLIELGDEIEFTNRENNEKLNVKVIGIHRYSNFKNMFENIPFEKFGGESVDWLLKQILEFYSEEDQEKYGVIGIEFKILK